MSKPDSGYFKGTSGTRKSYIDNEKVHDIIEKRTKGLDLQEHPAKFKMLGSKKWKELREKRDNRTITKEEYKRLNWNEKMSKRRQKGVADFWNKERERIIERKATTRNWNGEQISDILNGNRPKYRGKTMESHHIFSVAKYPHLADKGEIIYPATHEEHFRGWHGGNYKNSQPGKPIKKIEQF